MLFDFLNELVQVLERFQAFKRVDVFKLVESGRVNPAAPDHAPPFSPANRRQPGG